MLFFQKGKIARPTASKIRAVFKQSAVSGNTVRRWFEKFNSGNFSLENEALSTGLRVKGVLLK